MKREIEKYSTVFWSSTCYISAHIINRKPGWLIFEKKNRKVNFYSRLKGRYRHTPLRLSHPERKQSVLFLIIWFIYIVCNYCEHMLQIQLRRRKDSDSHPEHYSHCNSLDFPNTIIKYSPFAKKSNISRDCVVLIGYWNFHVYLVVIWTFCLRLSDCYQ